MERERVFACKRTFSRVCLLVCVHMQACIRALDNHMDKHMRVRVQGCYKVLKGVKKGDENIIRV
jgi:hypothetical protein